MNKLYQTCPYCGSHLDHGEACACKGEGRREPDPKENTPKRAAPPLREPLRVEFCRECGTDWNVSAKVVIPPEGYLCPRCYSKQRNAAGNGGKARA